MHRAAEEHVAQAAQQRAVRDELIRSLRRDDPQRWTYAQLAAAVGCTPELVAKIIKPQRR